MLHELLLFLISIQQKRTNWINAINQCIMIERSKVYMMSDPRVEVKLPPPAGSPVPQRHHVPAQESSPSLMTQNVAYYSCGRVQPDNYTVGKEQSHYEQRGIYPYENVTSDSPHYESISNYHHSTHIATKADTTSPVCAEVAEVSSCEPSETPYSDKETFKLSDTSEYDDTLPHNAMALTTDSTSTQLHGPPEKNYRDVPSDSLPMHQSEDDLQFTNKKEDMAVPVVQLQPVGDPPPSRGAERKISDSKEEPILRTKLLHHESSKSSTKRNSFPQVQTDGYSGQLENAKSVDCLTSLSSQNAPKNDPPKQESKLSQNEADAISSLSSFMADKFDLSPDSLEQGLLNTVSLTIGVLERKDCTEIQMHALKQMQQTLLTLQGAYASKQQQQSQEQPQHKTTKDARKSMKKVSNIFYL